MVLTCSNWLFLWVYTDCTIHKWWYKYSTNWQRAITVLPSGNLYALGETKIDVEKAWRRGRKPRKIVYQWLIFHIYVSLPRGNRQGI